MFELVKNERVKELIAISKSNSNINGVPLAQAHIELGRMLASCFKDLDPNDTTVVAMLRGGIFFAQGIYFELACKFDVYDPKNGNFIRPNTKNVILVDSVINTGKTILKILEPDMKIACCVINAQALKLIDDQVYAIRISNNQFVGCNLTKQKGGKGPDTTLRLFNQI